MATTNLQHQNQQEKKKTNHLYGIWRAKTKKAVIGSTFKRKKLNAFFFFFFCFFGLFCFCLYQRSYFSKFISFFYFLCALPKTDATLFWPEINTSNFFNEVNFKLFCLQKKLNRFIIYDFFFTVILFSKLFSCFLFAIAFAADLTLSYQ